MEPKDRRTVYDWNFVDGVQKALHVELFGQNVLVFFGLGEEEFTVFIKKEVAHKFVQVTDQYSTIVVICDSATIHSFSNQILK